MVVGTEPACERVRKTFDGGSTPARGANECWPARGANECWYDPAMPPSDRHESRPVFIIGSPRSGTSVLTWALGQHPNLLLTEESNWLGSFAIEASVAHARGSARARRSQLGALGITRDVFLSGLGDAIDRMVLAGREHLEATSHETAVHSPQQASPGFAISRNPGENKSRWIDGTPEYSLEVPMLVALFPSARFVHILRDADQVAASLLAFRDDRGRPIVGSAEEAYGYWLRTVSACLDAEQVLGAAVVHRVRHADLVVDAEPTLRGVLGFLGEPFASACLEPLQRRINSSFAAGAMPRAYPGARSEIIQQARRSSNEWLASPQPRGVDPEGQERWNVEFDARVLDAQGLQSHLEAARRIVTLSRYALDVSGVLLLVNWLSALARWIQSGGTKGSYWLGIASLVLAVYGWLRRAGLRAMAMRMLGRKQSSDNQIG